MRAFIPVALLAALTFIASGYAKPHGVGGICYENVGDLQPMRQHRKSHSATSSCGKPRRRRADLSGRWWNLRSALPKVLRTVKTPKTYLTAEQIDARGKELAAEIKRDFGDETLVVVGILQGSFIFFTDLVRHLGSNVRCEFLALSGYPEPSKSSGEVKILLDI